MFDVGSTPGGPMLSRWNTSRWSELGHWAKAWAACSWPSARSKAARSCELAGGPRPGLGSGGVTAVHDGDLGEGGEGRIPQVFFVRCASCCLFQTDVNFKGQQSLPACSVFA